MNAQKTIARTEKAVEAIEEKLSAIEKLEAQTVELTAGIEQLKLDEADLLASDKSESQKISTLAKLRIASAVKASELAKRQSEICAVKDECISAGISADRWVNALEDALVAVRSARIVELVSEIFIRQAINELKRFVGYSLAVKELAPVRFVWISDKPELALKNCGLMRQIFDKLAAAANSESEFDVIVGPGW